VDTSIRRTVSIPRVIGKHPILALIELGGDVFSKDLIYQRFFEYGVEGVERDIQTELKKKGVADTEYRRMLDDAVRKVSKTKK
jgi:hypothetical protein